MADGGERQSTTRQLLLVAATQEFSAFGYRRTSMEAIARNAGLSRATVYLHWSSKQALFRDLVTTLHTDRTAAMENALRSEGDVETRLTRLLLARYDSFVQITAGSPAAADLYDSHDRICGDVALAAEARARELVSTFVRGAASRREIDLRRAELSVSLLVDLLLGLGHAAKGNDPAAVTLESYQENLAASVRLVVRGLAVR